MKTALPALLLIAICSFPALAETSKHDFKGAATAEVAGGARAAAAVVVPVAAADEGKRRRPGEPGGARAPQAPSSYVICT